ncbi:MAG: hypothetical protein WA708_07055 [Acidobacteriaceae bacterium]
MHLHGKKKATGSRMFAVGLGIFIAAGLSLSPGVSSFTNHAPTLVFASSIDANCQVILDANNKLFTTPYHAYSTVSGVFTGGPPMNIEMIFVDGTLYTQVNGKWSDKRMTEQDVKDMETSNRNTNEKASCQHVRDESVNGEIAAVYNSQSESQGQKHDLVIWISKSKGLILRSDLDVVTTKGAKGHMSLRYEYSNVQKPKL